MKPESNAIEGALRRYLNYLLNRGISSGVTGVVMLDAKEGRINDCVLDALNAEKRCQIMALDEFYSAQQVLPHCVLVLNAHQGIPDEIAGLFEGILRTSSFERDVL